MNDKVINNIMLNQVNFFNSLLIMQIMMRQSKFELKHYQ